MLKWILILLKALTILPAVVSMARAEGLELQKVRNDILAKENVKAQADAKYWHSEFDTTSKNELTRIKEQTARLGDPETCICPGCTVLRASTHGYAKRMRGAISRYIEEQSA